MKHKHCTIPGCHEPHEARGYCERHYGIWRRHGDPTAKIHRYEFGKTLAERIAAYTKRSSGCWEWVGARNAHGYCTLNVTSGSTLVHRRVWELEHGPVPAGIGVLHRCDNPGCVRLDHLFLGTHADNMADKQAKSRFNRKLTVRAVLAIRKSKAAQKVLADKYDVSLATISLVRRGRIWRHLL